MVLFPISNVFSYQELHEELRVREGSHSGRESPETGALAIQPHASSSKEHEQHEIDSLSTHLHTCGRRKQKV